MHPFIYQNDGVECNCFDNTNSPQNSGLKPSRNFTSSVNPTLFHRATKSTESKPLKQQTSKIRTSLRREKPKTPNQSRTNFHSEEVHFQKISSNQLLPISAQRKQEAMPKWSSVKPSSHFINFQEIHPPIPMPQVLQPQPKRTNLVRNQIHKQNNQQFKIDFNVIQQRAPEPPAEKKMVRIMYQNPQNLPLGQPMQQVIFTARPEKINNERNNERIQKTQRGEISQRKKFDGSIAESNQNLRSSRESKKCSLRGSQRNDRGSVTPRAQPFRMVLKEIESVADQHQILDDQISEVIGRGWQKDREEESFIDYHKEDRLRTETHATRASNIKNSSTIYSNYGVTESHIVRR